MTMEKRSDVVLFVYSVAFFAFTLNALSMVLRGAPGGTYDIVLHAFGIALSLALALTLILRQYTKLSPDKANRAIFYILSLLLLLYWVSFLTHLTQLRGATDWILTLVLLFANTAYLILEIRQYRA